MLVRLLQEREQSARLHGAGAVVLRSERAGAELAAWAEASTLLRCCASACPLLALPTSTIAAAFSPDGELLASTQCVGDGFVARGPRRETAVHAERALFPPPSGDHTVKLTLWRTGVCVRTLVGHRRTPWVVRCPLVASARLPLTAPPAGPLPPAQQRAAGQRLVGLRGPAVGRARRHANRSLRLRCACPALAPIVRLSSARCSA